MKTRRWRSSAAWGGALLATLTMFACDDALVSSSPPTMTSDASASIDLVVDRIDDAVANANDARVRADDARIEAAVADDAAVGGADGTIDQGGDDAARDAASDVTSDVTSDAASDSASASDAAINGDASVPSTRVRASAFIRDFHSGDIHFESFDDSRTMSASALAVAAGVVVAVNPDSDSISVLDEDATAIPREIAVGHDPRTVALSSDAHYALVVNRGDGTVSFVDLQLGLERFYWDVGPMPYGIVLLGTRAFVTEAARGEIVVLDFTSLASLATVAHIPAGDSPAGIATCVKPLCALSAQSSVLVSHFYSGEVSLLDPVLLQWGPTISTGADTNLSQFIGVSPDGTRAYLPQTRSNADNPNRQFDTTVFPVVNAVELSASVTAPLRLRNAERITLDTADRPVGMPFAVDLSSDGRTMWIANAASDSVSVIDLDTQRKLAHLDVGANPRAIVLVADGTRALVNETLDGTLAVIDTTTYAVLRHVRLTRLTMDATMLAGKRLFHSAVRVDVAKDQWMACATCHFDGLTDRRTWLSFPDGPRNTTALFNLEDTLPLHWSGDLNEVQDVEATIRFIQAGTGLASIPRLDTLGTPLAGTSADLDALATFIRAIPAPPSPFVNDAAAMARGQVAFAELGCATCHPAPLYTDRTRHDVGTGNAAVERNGHGYGTAFDTPSLRALWLSPPYLHDGTAATLSDVLSRGSEHNVATKLDASTRQDLTTFLRSL